MKRLECYPDEETIKRIRDAAARSKLSVSRWLIQAALEKLGRYGKKVRVKYRI